MKGVEFINILRKVVCEEVRSAVKEELRDFFKVRKKTTESVEGFSKTTNIKKHTKQVSTKPVMKNPMFEGPMGSILAETYASMQNTNNDFDTEAEWPEMNMGMLTSNMIPGQPMPISQNNDHNTSGEINMNSLVRDYSQVLKAAEAKSQMR